MVLLAGVPPPHRIAKDWKRILNGEVLRLPRGTPARFGRLVATALVPVPETRPSATAALSSAAWLLGDGRMMSWRAAKEAQMRSRKEGGSGGVDKADVGAARGYGPGGFGSDRSRGPSAGGSVAVEPRRRRRRAGSRRPGVRRRRRRRRRRVVGRTARRSDPSSPGTTWSPRGRNPKESERVHGALDVSKIRADPTPAMPPRRPSIDQELHGAARRARTDSRRSKFERAAAFVLSVALGRDKTAALVSALREAGYDDDGASRKGRGRRAAATRTARTARATSSPRRRSRRRSGR